MTYIIMLISGLFAMAFVVGVFAFEVAGLEIDPLTALIPPAPGYLVYVAACLTPKYQVDYLSPPHWRRRAPTDWAMIFVAGVVTSVIWAATVWVAS